jgi:sarcosine oxidase/L-pipecolate oxidase
VIRKSWRRSFGLRLTPRRPDGNFLIDYHPSCNNLFIATGGSGHAFKFFPVIGEKVLAAIERRLDLELKNLWSWRTRAAENFIGTDDGSRAGQEGMLLDNEMSKPRL